MALLDVSKASRYGMAASWAEAVFSGNMYLGMVDACTPVDLPIRFDGCAPKQLMNPQIAIFDDNSTVNGAGLTFKGGDFLNKNSVAASDWDNMSSNANSANPININGVVLKDGNTQESSLYEGTNIYFDYSNFDPSGITFIQDGASATIGEGKVTTFNKQMAAGAGASVNFKFIPEGSPKFSLEYSSKNSVSSTISNGTINSSSNTQTASVSISESLKASAKIFGDGVESKATIEAGWQGAWTNTNEVSFSDASTNSSETSSSITVEIDLNNLTKNPDGTYGVPRVSPKVNGKPEPGASQPSITNFVAGQEYKAVIQYNQSNVENTVTGTYKIGGTVGSIIAKCADDNIEGLCKPGDTVAKTAAQAIAAANTYQGASVFNYGTGSVGDLNDAMTEVSFNGTSVFSTKLQTDFSVNYYAVPAPSSALASTKTSNALGLNNKTRNVSKYSLGLVNSSLLEAGNGVWLALETPDGDRSVISGGGTNSNVVEASPLGMHKFINFSDSILYGNSFRDAVKFKINDTGNTVYTRGGNDKVTSKGGDNSTILGDGDDIYHLKAGKGHRVEFGEGRDTFVIHKAVKDSFYIADFDYIDDRFEFTGKLNPADFQAKLVNPGDQTNLDGASLEFYRGKTRIGTASIDRKSASYDALTNRNFAQELAFLNAKYYNLDSFSKSMSGDYLNQSQMFKETVLGQGLLTKETIDSSDWLNMNTNKRAKIVNNVMMLLDGVKTGQKYWKGIIAGLGPAVDEFSFDMVRDSLLPAAIGQAQDTLV